MNSGQDDKRELSGGTWEVFLSPSHFCQEARALVVFSLPQWSSGRVPGWELRGVHREVSLTWAEMAAVPKGLGCFAQQRPLVFADCAGCKEEIKHGQSLLALDKQWHVSCFKCQTCSVILTGEYISKWVSPRSHAASWASHSAGLPRLARARISSSVFLHLHPATTFQPQTASHPPSSLPTALPSPGMLLSPPPAPALPSGPRSHPLPRGGLLPPAVPRYWLS